MVHINIHAEETERLVVKYNTEERRGKNYHVLYFSWTNNQIAIYSENLDELKRISKDIIVELP